MMDRLGIAALLGAAIGLGIVAVLTMVALSVAVTQGPSDWVVAIEQVKRGLAR